MANKYVSCIVSNAIYDTDLELEVEKATVVIYDLIHSYFEGFDPADDERAKDLWYAAAARAQVVEDYLQKITKILDALPDAIADKLLEEAESNHEKGLTA